MENLSPATQASLASLSLSSGKGIGALAEQSTTLDGQRIAEVADEFEALFVNMMLKAARDASQGDGLFDSSEGDTYREMLDQQLAMAMAKKTDLGIADALKRDFGGMADAEKHAPVSPAAHPADHHRPRRPGVPSQRL